MEKVRAWLLRFLLPWVQFNMFNQSNSKIPVVKDLNYDSRLPLSGKNYGTT